MAIGALAGLIPGLLLGIEARHEESEKARAYLPVVDVLGSLAGVAVRLTECPRIVLAAGIIVWMVFYVPSYAPTVQAVEAGRLAMPRSMMDFYVPRSVADG